MNPNFDALEQILSDFKVPRRKLELDAPIPINEIRGKQDQVYEEALNNDYLAFTRNLKIAKTVPLTELEKTKQDELVNKVYNFEYRPNPDSKTDYDILKEVKDTTQTKFNLNLEQVVFEKIRFSFKNDKSDQFYSTYLSSLNLEGAFSEKEFSLHSKSDLFNNSVLKIPFS